MTARFIDTGDAIINVDTIARLDPVKSGSDGIRRYALRDRDGHSLGVIAPEQTGGLTGTIVPAPAGQRALIMWVNGYSPPETSVEVQQTYVLAWRIDSQLRTPIVAPVLALHDFLFTAEPDGTFLGHSSRDPDCHYPDIEACRQAVREDMQKREEAYAQRMAGKPAA